MADEPKTADYEVVGTHPVDGVAPGGTVALADGDRRARSMLRAGVIRPKPKAKRAPRKGKAK